MERHDPWAPFERHRRKVPTPTAPEPPTADELAEIAVAVEGRPEAKSILHRIEVGDTVDPIEVFSLLPDAAPDGWKVDRAAAERLESKLALDAERDTWDEHKDLDPEIRERVERADRFRARWERTFANILRRHWERRRAVVLAKVRSTQFRKGTPLWDPPGEVDLESRLDVLIDVEAWDRELRAELESALEDLRAELVSTLDVKAAPDARNQEWPAWILRWIDHALSFNRRAAGAIRKVLQSNPIRVADVEDAVNDHVSRTMAYVGDQVATSLATGSIGEAQQQEAIRAGAIEKIWYSAQDGRVRPQHRHANGQRVPIDRPFRVRDRKGVVHSMMHPGDITAPPDLWMNCRCVSLFVTDLSRRLWLTPDGDVFDPYGRPTLIKSELGLPPSRLGIDWEHKGVFARAAFRAAGVKRRPEYRANRGPRDADGDGLVYEGTPRERVAVGARRTAMIGRSSLGPVIASAERTQEIGMGADGTITAYYGPDGSAIVKEFNAESVEQIDREVGASTFAALLGVNAPIVERNGEASTIADLVLDTDGNPAPTLAEWAREKALAKVGEAPPGVGEDWKKWRAAYNAAGRDAMEEITKSEAGRKIALLDFIIKNHDRHDANVLIVDGQPVAIDHSRSLHTTDDPMPNGEFDSVWIEGHDRYEILNGVEEFKTHFTAEDLAEAAEAIDALEAMPKDRQPPEGQIKQMRRRLALLLPEGAEPPEPGFTDKVRRRIGGLLDRKAAPRDGDGDGLIYEGTPWERPAAAPLREVVRAATSDGSPLAQGSEATVRVKVGPLGSVVIKEYDEESELLRNEAWAFDIAEMMGVPAPRCEVYGQSLAMDLVTLPDGTPAPTLQEWSGADMYDEEAELLASGPVLDTPEAKQLALFDFITGNTDRHSQNILVVDGRPVSIDHSQTLDPAGFAYAYPGMFVDHWMTFDGDFEDWSVASHPWTPGELSAARAAIEKIGMRDEGSRPTRSQLDMMLDRISQLDAVESVSPDPVSMDD